MLNIILVLFGVSSIIWFIWFIVWIIKEEIKQDKARKKIDNDWEELHCKMQDTKKQLEIDLSERQSYYNQLLKTYADKKDNIIDITPPQIQIERSNSLMWINIKDWLF